MTNRLLFSALLFLGVQSGPGPHTTLAQFMTSAGSSANQFSSGTVHISDTLGTGTTLSMGDLVAGDNFDAELTLANGGSLSLSYAMSTLTTGDATLATALTLTVRTRTTNPCAARDGAILYTGPLSSALLGDPAQGIQSGDRVLGAGASEPLCFTLEVPNTVTVQGSSVAATFTFDAQQA